MKDWKHKLMIDNVANFFVEPENRIQSEVPYQWYGFKGYVDLVVRSIESNKVIEVKTDIVDFGATIRQHNRMTSSNALKCVVSDYEKRSPQQKIGNFTQTKIGGFS